MTRVPAVRETGVQPVRQKHALLVLGPHRSGTSAATRLLNLLGADIAEDLLPPAPDNQAGFWESRSLVELHDEVLDALGVRWHTVRDLDPEFFSSARSGPFVERLQSIIGRDYGGSGVFVVKDPRMCRLLPLWRSALAALAIQPSCILVLRNPHEAAASLAVRDGIPIEKGLLIWLWHVLDAEWDSRGLARAVVSYDEILADWRGPADRLARELGFTWARSPREAQPAIEQFLSRGLRHHEAVRLPQATDPLVLVANRVHALLASACHGEPLDLASLDVVRDQLRAASRMWVHLDGEESRKRAEETARLGREVVSLHLEVEGRDGRIAVLEEGLAGKERQGTEMASRIAGLEENLADKERRGTEMANRIAGLERSLADEERRGTEAANRIAGLEQRLAEEVARSEKMAARILDLTQLQGASRRAIEGLSSTRSPRLFPRLRAAMSAVALRRMGQVMVLDRATRRAVEQSGLFDPVFYLVSAPDLRSLALDPYFHFVHWGGLEGRDPHPLFDSSFYLEANPDVAAARINPLLHYWRFGASEGRNPHPLFDTAFYLTSNPEVGRAGANPLAHYLREGVQEGRRAHPDRDAEARARLGL